MKKNILLINPEQNSYHKSMYPSGALLLLGTICKNNGHNVKIIDATTENYDIIKMRTEICSFKPHIVGVTINTFQTKNAKLWLKTCKEISDSPLTVIGGPHVSSFGIDIFEQFPYADISVIGEGEFTFQEIIDDKPLETIKGICYKNTITEPRQLSINLDHIPLLDFSLTNLLKYQAFGKNKSMYIMASRGCPAQCIYCNKSVFGFKVRYKQPDKVIEEIKYLHDKHNIKFIYFQDDTLNLNRKWLEEIFNLIISDGLNIDIEYMVAFRVSEKLLDKEILELAKRSNVTQIFYGVESGNQEMLDRIKKGTTISEIKRAFRLTHEAGIKSIAAFIIGLPGETEDTIKDTIKLWQEINPAYVGFTMATPYPATVLHNILSEKNHILEKDYDKYHFGGNYVRSDKLSLKELEFYTAFLRLSSINKHFLKLPFFAIGRNKILCNISIYLIRLYRRIKCD